MDYVVNWHLLFCLLSDGWSEK